MGTICWLQITLSTRRWILPLLLSPCLNMKQIIPINKKVNPEEGAENSIVQQVPPINYYESDIMKPTVSQLSKNKWM